MLTLTAPFDTRFHRLRAGPKLAGLALATALLLPIGDPWLLALASACVAALYLSEGPRFGLYGLRMLRPLWPFLLVLALWHLATSEPARGLAIGMRMIAAVALANLVTMTTRMDDMIAVIERLARPLARLGLSPRVLAVAVALVVRFVPVMLARFNQLIDAWRMRSTRRPNWRLVLPAVLLALDDADHVADALRARGGL